MVKQQSGKCVAAYVYASAGIDESTTDVVFGGHAMIAEYGTILAESDRFKREDQLICTDVDIQRLVNERYKSTSFMGSEFHKKFRKIPIDLGENNPDNFKRNIPPHPFVPSNPQTRDIRCEEIFKIQTAGLAKRFEHTHLKKALIAIVRKIEKENGTVTLLYSARDPECNGAAVLRDKLKGYGVVGKAVGMIHGG
jgi:NAD+ synthase (glutamine-hydrolysing)